MLEELFNKLDLPSDTSKDSYSTNPIFNSSHRLGKNLKNEPSILFKTADVANRLDYLGKYIHLRFNVNCTLNENTKKIIENYTILTCTSEDEQTKKNFLDICETSYLNIGENPTNSQINELTENLIELFKTWSASVTDFIGLWGELFMIASSNNSVETLEAWHNHNDDKYDFYDNNSALEVKCSTRERKHEFRHHQLVSNLKEHYLASVLTKPDSSKGLSVLDLYKKILKNKLSNPQINKLKKIYFGIVKGSPEIIINSQKYDYNFAKKNTLFFSISEISTLKNNDVSISNIKYTMDLSQKRNAESLGKNGFLSNLHFTD